MSISNDINNSKWYQDTQLSFMDLGSKNIDLMKITDSLVDAEGNVDQAKMLAVQNFMQQRQQLIGMITSLMKSLHEMAMSVIRNFSVR